jgi:hypothetical protein
VDRPVTTLPRHRRTPGPDVRHTLAALVLAIATLVGLGGLAPVAAYTEANGVTWSIDDNAKTITADIRITLTPRCTTLQRVDAAINPLSRSKCTVDQAAADAIKANIEKIWNNGNKYYCYDIVVHVDIKIDNSNSNTDPANRVRVQLAQGSTSGVRSITKAVQGDGATWNDSTPNSQVTPVNDGAASSTWGYPSGSANTFAHEAGHILGLDDGYEDYTGPDGKTQLSRLRPGAADDLMANTANSNIDKTSLRRMVERAGYKKTQLKCNYKIDQQSMGGHITGKKCDPLGGFWRSHGTYQVGTADGTQDWAVSINADTMRGTFDYTDHQVAQFAVGITVTTDGTAFGDATLSIDDELNAHMHLKEQWHTYVATVFGQQRGHDQNAAPTSADFTWEAIGKCK